MRVAFDGQPVELPASKKTRGLLGYLLSSTHPRSRNELCDLLWAEAEDPRGALRWSLSKLRTSLGPDKILANRNTVELNTAAIEVDAAIINAASGNVESNTTETLRAIETLFRGEFLNGLELSSCYGFYEWCQSERSRYGRLHAQVLETLISRHSDQPGAALEFAHKLVGMDPFQESSHIRVIELLLALGRPEDATVQAAHCRNIFELELGVEPSQAFDFACQTVPIPATSLQMPLERRQANSGSSSSSVRSLAPFVGRDAEYQLVRSAFDGSGPAVALIVGPPGIGKSTLLDKIGKDYGQRRLSAHAVEVERSRPFGIWLDALEGMVETEVVSDIRHKLREGLIVMSTGSETLTVEQLFADFRLLLLKLSQVHPVLIALDDAQWMERSSCALLSYLIRHLDSRQVHFCIAARAGEIDDNEGVQSLLSGLGNDVQRIALTGLSETDASSLVKELRPTANVQDVVRKAQGNPLYLMELSRTGGQGSMSTTLLDVLADRLERLSQPAIAFASWASIFGRTTPMNTAIKASGLDLSFVLSAIEELENYEIIRPNNAGNIEFTHDLVRDSAYERISNTRRRLMHGRVAEMLAIEMTQNPSIAVSVLHHCVMTDNHSVAAEAAVIAGQHALKSFANSEAAELARRGLFHVEKLNVDSERIRLSMALLGIQVLSVSGISSSRTPEFIAALQAQITKANQHMMADEVAQGEHLLSVLFQELGDLQEASFATARAADASRQMDAQKKVRQLANSARCLLELGRDIPKATTLSRDADQLAEEEGVADSEVFWSRGLLAYWNGGLGRAANEIAKALELAEENEDRWRQCKCLTWATMIALEQNHSETAISHATCLGELAAQIGEGAMAPLARTFIAMAQRDDDELNDALKALEIADDKAHLAYVLNLAADHYRTTGDTGRALTFARKAFGTASEIGNANEKVFARSLAMMLGEDMGAPITETELDEWSKSYTLNARVRKFARSAQQERKTF